MSWWNSGTKRQLFRRNTGKLFVYLWQLHNGCWRHRHGCWCFWHGHGCLCSLFLSRGYAFCPEQSVEPRPANWSVLTISCFEPTGTTTICCSKANDTFQSDIFVSFRFVFNGSIGKGDVKGRDIFQGYITEIGQCKISCALQWKHWFFFLDKQLFSWHGDCICIPCPPVLYFTVVKHKIYALVRFRT